MNELTKEMLIKELVSDGYAEDADRAMEYLDQNYIGEYEDEAHFSKVEFLDTLESLSLQQRSILNSAVDGQVIWDSLMKHDCFSIKESPFRCHIFSHA